MSLGVYEYELPYKVRLGNIHRLDFCHVPTAFVYKHPVLFCLW
jgi:hypothetical protein